VEGDVPAARKTEIPDSSAGGERTAPVAVSWRWAEHLGTGLTIGYLLLILIGIFHNGVLLALFRVNVLDYAEPSDFLLAPLRDPLVILATAVPVLAMYLYLRWAERRSERLHAKRYAQGLPLRWWHGDPERYRKVRVPIWILTIVVWVLASGLRYEKWAADRLQRGHGPRVQVELTTGQVEAGSARRPVMLIGATSRFLFLYRIQDRQTVIVPTENVLRILPERKVAPPTRRPSPTAAPSRPPVR
jgi:hypothetical protein